MKTHCHVLPYQLSLSLSSRRPLSIACALGLAWFIVGSALADEPQEKKDAKNPTMLDAVKITATKRTTSVQKTPMAITAITAETLEDIGANDVKDYVKMAPGLSVQEAGPGQTRLTTRGIYSAGEATTGIYYDETPISGSVGTTSDSGGHVPDLNLYDVDRVEVLRGPQGTLYGSSSMAGAIRVIYNKPDANSFEGNIDAGYSSTQGGASSWKSNLMLNLPLVPGELAARVVAFKSRLGGYIDNSALNLKNINDADSNGARLMLRYTPNEDLTLDLSYASSNSRAISSAWTPHGSQAWTSNTLTLTPYDDHTRISNATLNWNLGWANLVASSSYFDRVSNYAADTSGLMQYYTSRGLTAANAYIPSMFYYPSNTRNFTNEVRISSLGDNKIDWTAGVYSENRRDALYSQLRLADANSGEVIKTGSIYYQRHIATTLKQEAAFAEGTWHATSKLNATLGMRYYQYDKHVAGYTNIANSLIGASITPLSTSKASESGFLYKGNVSFQFTPTSMAYITVADGMRPGGANQVIGLSENLTAYKSDSLWNYELGFKSSFFDHRMTTNFAAYQINWHDMQISATTTNGAYSFLTNAGAARIRGIEGELAYRPIAGWDFSANFNYIDARLVADQLNNNIQASSSLGQSGDRIPFIAKWTGAVSATHRWSLTNNYDGMIRLDMNYVGKSYSSFRPIANRINMGGYSIINLRTGIEDASGKWSASVYANNLTNKVAITTATLITSQYALGRAYSIAPRTIGVDLEYHF